MSSKNMPYPAWLQPHWSAKRQAGSARRELISRELLNQSHKCPDVRSVIAHAKSYNLAVQGVVQTRGGRALHKSESLLVIAGHLCTVQVVRVLHIPKGARSPVARLCVSRSVLLMVSFVIVKVHMGEGRAYFFVVPAKELLAAYFQGQTKRIVKIPLKHPFEPRPRLKFNFWKYHKMWNLLKIKKPA